MSVIALLNAEAGSTPSGTGSFTYFTNFRVLVENLAFTKLVGIWGHDQLSGNWSFFPCSFSHSVPNNSEIWQSHVPDIQIDQFDVVYQVSGNTFWDNNAGFNYRLDNKRSAYRRYRKCGCSPKRLSRRIERRPERELERSGFGEKP